MKYIEKLDLQTEEIKEVETLEKHSIINDTFSVNKYNGHTREFLPIGGDYDDGYKPVNETYEFGISCSVSKELRNLELSLDDIMVNSNKYDDLKSAILDSSGKKLLIENKTHIQSNEILIENINNLNIECLGKECIIEFNFEDGARFKFKNCNNLKIKNLSIKTSTINERIFNNTCGLEIENCNNVVIENIKILQHTGFGILVTSCNNVTINNNVVTNTMADGIHIANSNGKKSSNIRVINNIIDNTGDDGIASVGYKHNGGLQNEDIIICSNIISNAKARGISSVGNKNLKCYSNTINGTSGSGLIIIQDYVLNADGSVKYSSHINENCDFYNNSLRNINKIVGQGYPSTKRESILIEAYESGFANKNININNNNVYVSNFSAIAIRNAIDVNVRNNEFIECGENFLLLKNIHNSIIDNNKVKIKNDTKLSNIIQFSLMINSKIINNTVIGGNGYVCMNGNEDFSSSITFENNTVEFNTLANNSVGGCSFGKINNLICRNNYVYSINNCAYDYNIGNVTGEIILKDNISRTGNNAKTLLSSYSTIQSQPVEIFKTVWGLSAPTTGSWRKGDICYNYNPTPNNYIGWICTTDGTPGTWKRFGQIEE